MVDKLQKAITVLVMTGLGMAAAMVILKWLIDMGFAWAMVAVCAGVLIWRYASDPDFD